MLGARPKLLPQLDRPLDSQQSHQRVERPLAADAAILRGGRMGRLAADVANAAAAPRGLAVAAVGDEVPPRAFDLSWRVVAKMKRKLACGGDSQG